MDKDIKTGHVDCDKPSKYHWKRLFIFFALQKLFYLIKKEEEENKNKQKTATPKEKKEEEKQDGKTVYIVGGGY